MVHADYLYPQHLNSNLSSVTTSPKLSVSQCLHLDKVGDPAPSKVVVTFLTMLLHSGSHRLEDQVSVTIDQPQVSEQVIIVLSILVFLAYLVLKTANCLIAYFREGSHHFPS